MTIKTDFVAGSQDASGNVSATNSNFSTLEKLCRGESDLLNNIQLRGNYESPVAGDAHTKISQHGLVASLHNGSGWNDSLGVVPNTNLINPALFISETTIDGSGELVPSGGQMVAKVAVIPNTTYCFGSSDGNFGVVRIEDASNTKLQSIDMNYTNYCTGGRFVTTPANSAWMYVRIKTAGHDYRNTRMVELGRIVSQTFTPYGQTICVAPVKKRFPYKLATMGSSTTAQPLTWSMHINRFLDYSEYRNFAVDGARWCHESGTVYDINSSNTANRVIWNQVNALITSGYVPDVVFIFTGGNDISTGVPLGVPLDVYKAVEKTDPKTVLTVSDGIRFSLDLLIASFPNIKIVLASPTQYASRTYEEFENMANTIKACSKYHAVAYVPLWEEGGIYKNKEMKGYTDTYDGTHYSAKGSLKVGAYLCNAIANAVL